MKSVLATLPAIVSLLTTTPAVAALSVGDTAPAFSAPGAQGGAAATVDLAALLKAGPVVLYFFPSAFTDSAESREFAANFEAFRAAGVSVVGVSRDSVETLTKYSVEACGGKFAVASADEAIVNGYDVNDTAMFNTRTTYVIGTDGRIAFVRDDPDGGGHVKSALAFVQGIKR